MLVAYISSVIPARLLLSDLLLDPSLPEFRSTNLKTSSALRLHKLATIHCSSLARYLGVLDDRTRSEVASKLRGLLKL
jgi:mRNA-degrading endonuclease toxin of MazEF toxin-antitoxin module